MKTRTDAFYEAFSAAFETLFGKPCPDSLFEASEGDARKYMKKAIEANGLSGKLTELYGPNWSEAAFKKMRALFVHHGCDVYFVPGLARIAYGELALGDYGENERGLNQLCELVAFITTAHKNEFSRNLEHITTVQQGPQKGMRVRSNPMSLKDLAELFMREQEDTTEAQRNSFQGTDGGNGYKVIELDSFETAHKFLNYTDPDSPWCYLEDEDTFDGYRANGNRLYLALAPGFENLKPGDRGYGRSMIGFDMGPVGPDGTSKLCACSNRYNHAENKEAVNDSETGELVDPDTGMRPKKGDAAYNEIQLSKILGVPVWKTYLGFDINEVVKSGKFDDTTMARLWSTKEELANALKDPEALQEKYNIKIAKITTGVYAIKPTVVPETPKSRWSTRDDFRCYVCLNGPKGNPFWGKGLQRLPGHALIIMGGKNGNWMVDESGMPIITDIFTGFRISQNIGFPIAISRGDPTSTGGYDSRLLKWNYVDENGNYLCDDWFDYADEFNRYGYAQVGFVNVDENIKKLNVIDTNGHYMIPGWATYISDGYGDITTYNETFHVATLEDKSNFILDVNYKPIHDVPFSEINVMYNDAKEGVGAYGFRKVQHAVTQKYSIFDPATRKFLIDWYDDVGDIVYYAPLVAEYVKVTNERDQVNFAQLRKGLLSDVWFNGVIKLSMFIYEKDPLYYVGLQGGVGVWSPNFGLITKKPVDRVYSLAYTESPDTRYVVTRTGDTVSLWDVYGNSRVATEQELRTIQEMSRRSQINGITPRWM